MKFYVEGGTTMRQGKNFSVRTDLLIEIKEDSKISLRNHHYRGIEYSV